MLCALILSTMVSTIAIDIEDLFLGHLLILDPREHSSAGRMRRRTCLLATALYFPRSNLQICKALQKGWGTIFCKALQKGWGIRYLPVERGGRYVCMWRYVGVGR